MPGSLGKPSGLPPFPRRYRVVVAGTSILLSIIYLLSAISAPSTVPVPSAVRDHLPDHIPHPDGIVLDKLNPFSPPKHRPPVQTNSSVGDTKWHSDWRWLNPFSSDVTFDEERSVLPPLAVRPPIYTFYEVGAKVPKEVKQAEEKLLFQWRRAWWAQGFKPVVLGRADALQNPLYKKVQLLNLEDSIEKELARWLAWGSMGGGILADWRTFPMSAYGNPLLSFLRRGRYPKLTRYEKLKGGLFCGNKEVVTKAVQEAMKKSDIKKALTMADPMFSDMFSIDSSHDGVAFYDTATTSERYKAVADILFHKDRSQGLQLLGDLINAHLHSTWQASFSEVVVLKPLAKFTTTLTDPALEIAGNLTACPEPNPIQGSCPPNRPKCKNCIASQHVAITTPSSIRNSTRLEKFFIGTVPHPYTTVALKHNRDSVDAAFVRRLGYEERDTWLTSITTSAGTAANRLKKLKGAVASDWAIGRTLWTTAEDGIDTSELQWLFGFQIPHSGKDAKDAAKSETPVPGEERRLKKAEEKEEGRARPEKDRLAVEQRLLSNARAVVRASGFRTAKQKEAVEAWNLADMECWRFVKAWQARRMMVRKEWEKAERKFVGQEKGAGRWGRWFDG